MLRYTFTASKKEKGGVRWLSGYPHEKRKGPPSSCPLTSTMGATAHMHTNTHTQNVGSIKKKIGERSGRLKSE